MSETQLDLSTTAGKLADLRARLSQAKQPVGEDAIAQIRDAGRVTARERVLALLDPGSFVETDALAKHRIADKDYQRTQPLTDGAITGYGTIDGRRVCVFAHDETIFDGGLGEVNGEKICKVYDLAMKTGVPIVSINAAQGTRPVEGLVGLELTAKIYHAAALASGVVPQIAVVAGDNTGLAALAPNFADVVIHAQGAVSHVAETEPDQNLGGADIHECTTGQADIVAASDVDAILAAREVIGFLPINNHAEAPRTADAPQTNPALLDGFIPDDDASYDMLELISQLVDNAGLLQLKASYATNVITAFARMGGRAVGVVANQPATGDGSLSSAAAAKAAGFIRLCDAFNLPVITFTDSPGALCDEAEEHAGVSRTLAQLVYAYAEATVGIITVITRKALGVSYVAMGSKTNGADLVYAWPTAQIAVNGDAELSPYAAAETGLVDAVIEPSRTRDYLLDGLRLLERKVITRIPRKHDTMPIA